MTAEPISVLVVDDSAVVRRIVSAVISDGDAMVAAAQAANGREALDRLHRGDIDVVILDLEMPEMDGLTALAHLRRDDPSLPVIVLSNHTTRGARATLDALAAGASDYLTKPAGMNNLHEARAYLREELLPRIEVLGARRRQLSAPASPPLASAPDAGHQPGSLEVVAIGSSTGGPAAVADLLAALGGSFNIPILLAQHMPKRFTPLFAERLDREVPLAVREATDGEPLRGGTVYVSPGDQHLLVRGPASQAQIRLSQQPPVNSCRPSVDVLFASVAEVFGSRGLAVVLTGMGRDGLDGARQMRAAHAAVVVQDEPSSVVWGMPGAVAQAGLAEAVLPVGPMAAYLRRRAGLDARDPR